MNRINRINRKMDLSSRSSRVPDKNWEHGLAGANG